MLDAVIYLANGTRIEVTKQTLKYILIGFGFDSPVASFVAEKTPLPDLSALVEAEPEKSSKPVKTNGKSAKTA